MARLVVLLLPLRVIHAARLDTTIYHSREADVRLYFVGYDYIRTQLRTGTYALCVVAAYI